MASVLFLNSKTDSLPILHVEVTLYPRMIEEKQVQVSIKKEEKKSFPKNFDGIPSRALIISVRWSIGKKRPATIIQEMKDEDRE